MLGRPTRLKGKSLLVEVQLDSGRFTLTTFETTEPANDEARALLSYIPPEAGVPAA